MVLDHANVSKTISEIHMKAVDPNVFWALTAQHTRPALETNVKIHVQEFAVLMVCTILYAPNDDDSQPNVLFYSTAQCIPVNHIPTCICVDGYIGDPLVSCREPPKIEHQPINPCQPSPCGPNSKCRVVNDIAVCSCVDEYIGSPPNCRPECTVNSECPQNKACHRFKCTNPCAGTCGGMCDIWMKMKILDLWN